jgi:uncharacterized spore protein YtfJ
MSQIDELLAEAKDTLTVKRVYGEPYRSNGVTIIPAASLRGGFGGGEGEGSEDTPAGRGGGMGISARPIGVYQIEGDRVTWVPAVDLSRIIVMGQFVVIVAMLVLRSVLRRRKG